MRESRRERYYTDFPELVTGYELNPEQGLISVIIPEATTNLVTNPSVESGVTTGYAAFTGVMAATYNWQAYGAAGLQLTPAVSSESGFYYGPTALTINITYTASITIQGEAGKLYYIWFASTAGALIGTKRSWRGTGHKQRIWVTTVEPAGASRRVYVTRDGQYSDQNLWYADGLQIEAKAYPTTYCDGDQKGFLVNETPIPYLWNGTPRASTSSRSAQTRSGGREMNLSMFGFHLLTILGLGMAPLVDQSLPLPGRGELAQGTGTQAREFTLVGSLVSDGSRHLSAMLDDLEDAFKPDLTAREQPLILRYQAYEDDEPCGDQLDIICKYRGGLEGAVTNHLGERLSLNFKMYLPLLRDTYDSGIELGYQTSVADGNYILTRGTDGVWAALAAGTNGTVWSMIEGPDGSIYVGGSFTNLGDADGDRISKWNGTAFSSLGTGLNSGIVYALAIGPDGSLYVGGSFTLAGGVANTVRIAKWNGTVWSPLLTGVGNTVWALAFGPDGNLYVGGEFRDVGDTNGDGIVMWNGSAWVSLGTGVGDGSVYALAVDHAGNVYAGGSFTVMGGVANTSRIAKWNGASWSPLGTGTDADIYTLIIGKNGILYAGGNFDLMDGVPNTNHIAAWNGTIWSPLGVGANNKVVCFAMDSNGFLYVGGSFTSIGDMTPPDCMAMWNGSTWVPLDVNLSGNPTLETVLVSKVGSIYLGYNVSGTATSATVKVPNVGSSVTYPVFYFTGPGAFFQIKNYTNGKVIIPNLTLLAGETAVLDLNPEKIRFYSSFRGDILYTILPGSNLNFELLPGINNISAFAFGGTSAATNVFMAWKQQYWSQNGATWK